jgi:hypothetical protein
VKISFSLLLFLTIIPGAVSTAQSSMPAYPDVATAFFTNYSHVREEENDRLMFAKKKQGWYVHVIDRLHHDSVKNEQLFWDIQQNKYLHLHGFGPGLSAEEITKKMTENMRSDGPQTYEYERCR